MPTEEDTPSVEEVIATYLQQIELGGRPKPEDFLERFPELHEELTDFFELHEQMSGGERFEAEKGGVSFPTFQNSQTESSLTSNPPKILGDYEILEEIDRGGMGVVYKARHQTLNRIVALKLIRSGTLASDEEVERFLSEAEAAAALSHPNIVPIYDVGTVAGLVFYTMAFIEGASLSNLVSDKALKPLEAVRLIHKLCGAVDYAHRSGVYHRDLKPSNVLINDEGQPIIIDFGLAKMASRDDSLTVTGQILGTPAYMAPEIASGQSKSQGPAADVYALGGILYFLCARQPAFSGPTPFDVLLQVLDKRPPRPSKFNRLINKEVDYVCLKSLEKEPSQRYQSARDLGDDLEKILTGESINVTQATLVENLRTWWQREPILVAHVMGIGTTICIVASAYWMRGEPDVTFYYRIILLLVWLSTSFFLQTWVDTAKWNHVAIFTWLAIDVFLFTSLIAFAAPPRSMLLIGYPMMVVASALFYQRRFTVTKTALCVLGFLILSWRFPKDDFVRPDFAAIFVSGLLVICLCMLSMINRVRGLSRFYER